MGDPQYKALKYWTFYRHPKTNWFQLLEATWTDSFIDRKRKEEGRVFQSQHQASEAASK